MIHDLIQEQITTPLTKFVQKDCHIVKLDYVIINKHKNNRIGVHNYVYETRYPLLVNGARFTSLRNEANNGF